MVVCALGLTAFGTSVFADGVGVKAEVRFSTSPQTRLTRQSGNTSLTVTPRNTSQVSIPGNFLKYSMAADSATVAAFAGATDIADLEDAAGTSVSLSLDAAGKAAYPSVTHTVDIIPQAYTIEETPSQGAPSRYLALSATWASISGEDYIPFFQDRNPVGSNVKLRFPVCTPTGLCVVYISRLYIAYEGGAARLPQHFVSASKDYYGGQLRGTGSVGQAGTKVAFVMIPESISRVYKYPSPQAAAVALKGTALPDAQRVASDMQIGAGSHTFTATVQVNFASVE